jgi:bleomycin hydrolase
MTEIKPLNETRLEELREGFESGASNRLAMNAVTTSGIDKVARNYDRSRLLQRHFSVTGR